MGPGRKKGGGKRGQTAKNSKAVKEKDDREKHTEDRVKCVGRETSQPLLIRTKAARKTLERLAAL